MRKRITAVSADISYILYLSQLIFGYERQIQKISEKIEMAF